MWQPNVAAVFVRFLMRQISQAQKTCRGVPRGADLRYYKNLAKLRYTPQHDLLNATMLLALAILKRSIVKTVRTFSILHCLEEATTDP